MHLHSLFLRKQISSELNISIAIKNGFSIHIGTYGKLLLTMICLSSKNQSTKCTPILKNQKKSAKGISAGLAPVSIQCVLKVWK